MFDFDARIGRQPIGDAGSVEGFGEDGNVVVRGGDRSVGGIIREDAEDGFLERADLCAPIEQFLAGDLWEAQVDEGEAGDRVAAIRQRLFNQSDGFFAIGRFENRVGEAGAEKFHRRIAIGFNIFNNENRREIRGGVSRFVFAFHNFAPQRRWDCGL